MSVVYDAAVISTGLMAGVYFIYAVAVMPGLRELDDTAFVRAFQSIDTAIINPLFLATFFAPTLLCAVVTFGTWGRPDAGWIVLALGFNALIVAITVTVHVPLNDAIKTAGPVTGDDATTVRTAFAEGRWVIANWVRTVVNLAALVCLMIGRGVVL